MKIFSSIEYASIIYHRIPGYDFDITINVDFVIEVQCDQKKFHGIFISLKSCICLEIKYCSWKIANFESDVLKLATRKNVSKKYYELE